MTMNCVNVNWKLNESGDVLDHEDQKVEVVSINKSGEIVDEMMYLGESEVGSVYVKDDEVLVSINEFAEDEVLPWFERYNWKRAKSAIAKAVGLDLEGPYYEYGDESMVTFQIDSGEFLVFGADVDDECIEYVSVIGSQVEPVIFKKITGDCTDPVKAVKRIDKSEWNSLKMEDGLEEDLNVEKTAVNGKMVTLVINGKKYSYEPNNGMTAKEFAAKYQAMAKHSVGRALAWVKKNAITKDSYRTKKDSESK